ncbi:MAG: hypothetical protein KDK66_08945 [Deltaproteobacteria bacterium]|nr:hypothetical protein [Deltaproteobacteria bacterium]
MLRYYFLICLAFLFLFTSPLFAEDEYSSVVNFNEAFDRYIDYARSTLDDSGKPRIARSMAAEFGRQFDARWVEMWRRMASQPGSPFTNVDEHGCPLRTCLGDNHANKIRRMDHA